MAPRSGARGEACVEAGADNITAHLREDRRHIRDDDIERLAAANLAPLNLEMAVTQEMLAIALATARTPVVSCPSGGRRSPPKAGSTSRARPERSPFRRRA